MQRGLTLIETLIVVGIIVVLAGILLPVLLSARDRSKMTVDTSNLRQLGQAAAIYQDNNSGRFPMSARALVDSGYAPKDLVVSPRDQNAKGIANMLVEEVSGATAVTVVPTAYKMSYVGVLEQGWPYEYFQKNIEPAKAPGWLVNIVDCKPLQGRYLSAATGRYQRLLLDGAVQTRVQTEVTVDDEGSPAKGVHPVLLYIDEDGKWIDEHKL